MKKIFLGIIIAVFLGTGLTSFAIENITSPDDETTTEALTTQNIEQKTPQIQAKVVFDWLDISQAQRDENIDKYKALLFDNNSSKIYFDQREFKTAFAPYKKDRDYKHHYFLTNNGVTEDEEAKYCAFYYKNNTLVVYAIQYKKKPTNAFYYTAFGKLVYTDVMSNEYPNFPYSSMQYNRKGKLSSAIYFVSKDLQYMFGPDKEFQGIWYKDKMYDKAGKQTLTRSSW